MNNPLISMMQPYMQKQIQPTQKPINPSQFMQLISKLDKNSLAQLVSQARSQGIPDFQIEEGLNFILQNSSFQRN